MQLSCEVTEVVCFRVMAAALSLTFGRGGALIGNLLFGFLIDLNCVIPIVLFAAMLLGMINFRDKFLPCTCCLINHFHYRKWIVVSPASKHGTRSSGLNHHN